MRGAVCYFIKGSADLKKGGIFPVRPMRLPRRCRQTFPWPPAEPSRGNFPSFSKKSALPQFRRSAFGDARIGDRASADFRTRTEIRRTPPGHWWGPFWTSGWQQHEGGAILFTRGERTGAQAREANAGQIRSGIPEPNRSKIRGAQSCRAGHWLAPQHRTFRPELPPVQGVLLGATGGRLTQRGPERGVERV